MNSKDDDYDVYKPKKIASLFCLLFFFFPFLLNPNNNLVAADTGRTPPPPAAIRWELLGVFSFCLFLLLQYTM